jgi:hypothetical protein
MNNDDKPGCLAAILQALGLATKAAEQETLLYRVRDDFHPQSVASTTCCARRSVTGPSSV